jgi:hypothetical protein
MKHLMASIIFITIIVSFTTTTFAGWLIFHKPAFRGKVIDTDTKEPIEGAVVVAIYKTHTIIGGPAGGDSSVIKVKETLTDKKGEFIFPSYTTITQPNAREFHTRFIIYKPGHGSYPYNRITPPGHISLQTKERFFLAESFGKQGEIIESAGPRMGSRHKVTFGVVELPRLRTWKERRKANPSSISDIPKSKWPLLKEMIEKEDKWLRHNKGWRR